MKIKEKLLEQRKNLLNKKLEILKRVETVNDSTELDQINSDIKNIDERIKLVEETLQEEIPKGLEELNYSEERDENKFNPIKTYTQGSSGQQDPNKNLRQIASYSTKGNQNNNKYNLESVELREGETFSDRVIRSEETDNLDLGRYIRGIVTGEWEGAEAEKRSVTTSSMGTIIPTVLSSQILDYALNTSIFLKSEIPTVPMDSNNLTYAKIKRIGTPEFVKNPTEEQKNLFIQADYFKEELKEGKEIDLDLEEVNLKSKTCYAYSYVSLESIKSAKNLSQILIKAFGDVVSNAIDYAFLYGQYNSTESKFEEFAPEGILNDTNILSLTTQSTTWDDYIKAIGKIKGYNGLPTHYAINSTTEEDLNLLKTTDGQYLNKPKCLEFLNPVVSNQLEEGTSIVFDREALVVGIQNSLVIRMITDSDYCIKNGAIGFQIYTMLDCKTLYPQNICKITVNKAS